MIMLLFAASSLMEQGGVGVGVIRHPDQVRAHHLVRVLEDPEGLLQLGEDEDSNGNHDDFSTPEISSPPAPGRNPEAPPRRSWATPGRSIVM